MLFRADAAMRRSVSWDSELCAGEMLRLAGYRPAGGRRARGGRTTGRGWENPSGFAQPPPLSGEAIRALDGARASHERGGVAAGDGGVKPVPRRLCREKKAQRSLTSQAAPCYNVDMKG